MKSLLIAAALSALPPMPPPSSHIEMDYIRCQTKASWAEMAYYARRAGKERQDIENLARRLIYGIERDLATEGIEWGWGIAQDDNPNTAVGQFFSHCYYGGIGI